MPEKGAMDQGSQFTGFEETQALKDAGIQISMPLGDFANHLPVIDGKGRWPPLIDCFAINCRATDNRMIERLWPLSWFAGKPHPSGWPCSGSLKYECIYLNAFETGSLARAGIGKWLSYYNSERPHSTHGILTPDEAYERKTVPMSLAA